MHDLIIVGSGCAGYAAAMYAGRLGLKTLVLGDVHGGTIILTNIVENYPGFIRLTGEELANNLQKHALDYKDFVEMKEERVADIKKITKKGSVSFIACTQHKRYESKTIILATGTKHRELNIPGEKEFSSKGVHVCALCDGMMYKNKIVAVVGGSDSAAKEAILLTQWAKKVFIIYRKEKIRPEPVNMKRVEALIKKGKIEIINNTNVKEINGNKFVSSVMLDRPYKGKTEFKLDGIFIEIGQMPRAEFAARLGVKLNEMSEIIIDREAQTNVNGVFAAGDVVDDRFKQAIIGAAEGVAAAYSAYQHIKHAKLA